MELGHDDPRLAAIRLRRELLDSGAHSDQSLARAVQRGWLARPRRGAYVDGPLWRSLSPDQQYALRCRAAFRQAQTGVILSHASALPFHDAPVWGFDLGDVHLTRVDGRSGRREAGIRRHCGQLMSGDVVELHDVVVMSAVRATLEASLVGSVEASLAVANHFLHRGEYDLPTLAARYEASMDRWPSSLTTDLVLRLADSRHESVGESRMAYFFYARSLPKPIPQFEVYDGSTLVARVDFALPELGVWMEFDGRVKYERFLRSGESPADAVVREKRREEIVAELTGWRCLRVTWDDLADPARLERRVRDLIASVARSRRAAG